MEFTGQDGFATAGASALTGEIKAQCRSHFAPSAIHRRMSFISSWVTDKFESGGGICKSSDALRRRSSSLISGWPGTIAVSPLSTDGCFADSSRSNRSPASRVVASGPWHTKHRSARMGRMCLLNEICSAGLLDTELKKMTKMRLSFRMKLGFCRQSTVNERDGSHEKTGTGVNPLMTEIELSGSSSSEFD